LSIYIVLQSFVSKLAIINKFYYQMDRTKQSQKTALESMNYGIQRIDLLIVSISGAGIYVCLESLKFLKEQGLNSSLNIKIAGVFLAFAILINFISQFLSHKSNEKHWLWCEYRIDCNDKPSEKENRIITQLDTQSELYSNLTIWSNYLSAVIMAIGLSYLIFYFSFIF